MKIRKPVSELTLDNLKRYPVWEFALDEEGQPGQDETTVRPFEVVGALDPADGMFVVPAAFQLADGSTMEGYVTPPFQGDDSLGILQPVIVTGSGQVLFWQGVLAPTAEMLASHHEKLGRDAARTFPLEVTSLVELTCGPIRATVPGFMVLDDFSTGKSSVVT